MLVAVTNTDQVSRQIQGAHTCDQAYPIFGCNIIYSIVSRQNHRANSVIITVKNHPNHQGIVPKPETNSNVWQKLRIVTKHTRLQNFMMFLAHHKLCASNNLHLLIYVEKEQYNSLGRALTR